MFITSITAERTHGVFALDVPPPAQIAPVGTGRVALVGQFPWGPDGERREISQGEAKALFAPFGMNRLSTGYLTLLGKAFADLVIVRVLGTAAAKATCNLDDLMIVTAKYKGSAGNVLVATVEDASNGDVDHFDVSVTVSGATGARTEKIANINISGTGDDSYPTASVDFDSFVLIGSLTKLGAGRPANGTYLFAESISAEPAEIEGTIALTAGGLFGGGGTLNGLTFIVTSDSGSATTTFAAPANAAAVASQITTAAAGKFAASINASNHLVIASTTEGEAGSLLIGAGTANSALGFTTGATDIGADASGTGADGTIDAAAYIGTAQTGDRGIALLEGDKAVRHVIADDCGSGIRAAVNAGLKAHAALMGDRAVYINGNVGVSSAASVRSNAATYSSTNVVYADPWVWIFDDTTGSQQIVPSAPFLASVASQLPPSTSIAWKADTVQQMLGGIVRLEYDRGAGAGANTDAGVATLIREETGGHTIEAGVVTIAPANPAKRHLTRTLMGIFIVASLRRSLRGYIDAPNVRATWDQIYPPIKAFLDTLKRNSTSDAVALLPHIVDYGLGTPETANTRAEIKSGELKVPLQVELSSGIEKLIFLVQYGQTVSITLQN